MYCLPCIMKPPWLYGISKFNVDSVLVIGAEDSGCGTDAVIVTTGTLCLDMNYSGGWSFLHCWTSRLNIHYIYRPDHIICHRKRDWEAQIASS